jgi:SAM-dependent methyltransferase
MKLLGRAHGTLVHSRRIRRLSQQLAELIPQNADVLDVGCGDGKLAALIQQLRPDVKMQGIDVLVRDKTEVPIKRFDGVTIPFPDKSVDVTMFVDVLHHTEDPNVLLQEASRVAKKFIVIKDHTDDGFLSNVTLRFMDWVGNKPHGVVLPYNYWRERQWRQAFEELKFEIVAWHKDLKLYPHGADLFFGRGLHVITKLKVN